MSIVVLYKMPSLFCSISILLVHNMLLLFVMRITTFVCQVSEFIFELQIFRICDLFLLTFQLRLWYIMIEIAKIMQVEVFFVLLSFHSSNYKSFRHGFTFDMSCNTRQTGLEYSILKERNGRKVLKGLSSAVIYGPNASGKTNLIGAMETMKEIVLRGHIKNVEAISSPNIASSYLELIPHCNSKGDPVDFSIRFTEAGLLIDYTLSLDLGCFMDKDYSRKVIREELQINEKIVFSRSDQVVVELPKSIESYFNPSIKERVSTALEIANSGLNADELFLSNGFKTIFSKKLVSVIQGWFDSKFIVIYRSDAVKTMRKFANPKENTIYVEKTLTDAAHAFGITSNALGYKPNSEDDVILCSIFSDRDIALPAENFESYGTIRFVNEFPLVINALLNGATLVMDEFDASIHPMALMNIISIFHNDEINKKHAQLIFNTHNPIFLEASLFRRDEIKFVERDNDTNESSHYALSDFKTADGVRKGEDYMKNYFISRYGAIKDIDFSPLLEEIMSRN